MADRFGMPGSSCVIVLQREDGGTAPLTETIRELAPMEENDLLAEDGAGRVLIIKEGNDPAETAEFAMALLNTLEDEAGAVLKAGISDMHGRPEEWPRGYREALSALETGERFQKKRRVQVYGEQILERMAAGIPPEFRRQLRERFLPGSSGKILDEETRETAEAFFNADLNLSVAARQMFVHRNTLTYRLDKIQKETGLDLRKFNDAVLFRMLMLIPESEKEEDR